MNGQLKSKNGMRITADPVTNMFNLKISTQSTYAN